MRANRSIPDSPVMPVLGYGDVLQASAWLGRAFGFRERLRIGTHRVQLLASGGAVVVTDASPPADTPTFSVMLRVTGIDAHCDRARVAGATILQPPTTYPYGERQYSAADYAGYVWTFTESVMDVDPADWGGELMVR